MGQKSSKPFEFWALRAEMTVLALCSCQLQFKKLGASRPWSWTDHILRDDFSVSLLNTVPKSLFTENTYELCAVIADDLKYLGA